MSSPIDDRLSNLPEEILCEILSFLTTKEAVATSCLGRRWRFLWQYVPFLEFDESVFRDIGYKVLKLHKSQHLSSISFSTNYNKYYYHWKRYKIHLNELIRIVVARNVQKLKLEFEHGNEYHLKSCVRPLQCLLTCETLVELKLHGSLIVTIPADCAVRFPCLKKLHLSSVRYENDESLPRLLSGCSVLEDLILERKTTFFDGMRCCGISSSTLKSLVLVTIHESYEDELKINTPALQYLDLWASNYFRPPLHILVNGILLHLITTDIYLGSSSPENCVSVIKFVESLNRADSIILSWDEPLSDLEQFDSSFPFSLTLNFHNLTKLDLEVDWFLLTKFLELVDNLKVLIIRMPVYKKLNRWREPYQIPKCMLSSLTTVSIHGVLGGEEPGVLEMLRYILLNAKVLRRMEIDFKAKFNGFF